MAADTLTLVLLAGRSGRRHPEKRRGEGAGGAEGLLSAVLRDRKKMKEKVKAISSEAKASASIIGSLPFLVGGVVYLTSPDYIMVLFSTSTGNMILAGCLFWMGIGIFIMRQMINFEV